MSAQNDARLGIPIHAETGSDPLAKLPVLAARLGVPQIEPGAPASIILMTRDGQQYDLFDLAHALLDRLDRATR